MKSYILEYRYLFISDFNFLFDIGTINFSTPNYSLQWPYPHLPYNCRKHFSFRLDISCEHFSLQQFLTLIFCRLKKIMFHIKSSSSFKVCHSIREIAINGCALLWNVNYLLRCVFISDIQRMCRLTETFKLSPLTKAVIAWLQWKLYKLSYFFKGLFYFRFIIAAVAKKELNFLSLVNIL